MRRDPPPAPADPPPAPADPVAPPAPADPVAPEVERCAEAEAAVSASSGRERSGFFRYELCPQVFGQPPTEEFLEVVRLRRETARRITVLDKEREELVSRLLHIDTCLNHLRHQPELPAQIAWDLYGRCWIDPGAPPRQEPSSSADVDAAAARICF